ncbi:SDR family oxidoreductase [Pedobacter sp. HDW13]|uniref:polysaccharide biosynthesis C-terminal domain-containing protein n=1 Tax=Pedobacter sp. HDW13 TaxID=2714940 RepID=UPI0014082104|nr:NAD-dependent epimerase/dehydratase family protein [Pedobacter sp. HDW13]QIL39205.1 SDR family oxidoreductase [Pedobacter sp. HDW13]
MKIKIGITGQEGFVGQHLYHTLGLFPDEFERVDYHIDFFKEKEKLDNFVQKCDVIVHLAAMNRHENLQVLYNTNVSLVQQLIDSLNETKSKAHVLFSSSSQEERDNLYGKSKRLGREMLIDWAAKSGGTFTGLVIPNVFGPFGMPFYNSFIATFCHQLTHSEQPKIDVDGEVKLIYVGDLVNVILKEIRSQQGNPTFVIPHTDEYKVSVILQLLEKYKAQYFLQGIIPELNNRFELNLFNSFRTYINLNEHYPFKFTKHMDARGAFVEIIKLNVGGQVSFSTTVPGITRGNHYHTRKIERFAVIKGKALIQLRRIGTNEIFEFYLDGNEPSYVDMPIWYTHNIKNIGEEELYTNFWINEFYDPADPDTFMEEV